MIKDLAFRNGMDSFLGACLDLLAGADRTMYVDELRCLTGHAWEPGDSVFSSSSWPDYWVRSWGARGLLHVWDERATDAIVAGLADEHWRPAEMCLKVAARHDVVGSADGAAQLSTHGLPRVRIQALRALAVVGDVEHYGAVLAAQSDDQADVRRQAQRTAEAMRSRLDLS